MCVHGKLQCLRGRCKRGRKPDLHKLDKCLACKGTRRPVCGNDGKTYPSACVAMNCRQLDSGDFTPGACHKKVSIFFCKRHHEGRNNFQGGAKPFSAVGRGEQNVPLKIPD